MRGLKPLRLTVALGEGETQCSFASRLAARNGRFRLQPFCKDIGLTIDNVIVGKDYAIEKIALLGGVSADALARFSVRTENGWHQKKLAAEIVNQAGRGLKPIARVCPKCAAIALEGTSENAFRWSIPDQIDHWIAEIETCVIHDTAFVALEFTKLDTYSRFPIERAHIVGANEELIRNSISNPKMQPTKSYEHYLSQRLRGTATKNEILDELPITFMAAALDALGEAIFDVNSLHADCAVRDLDGRRDRREAAFVALSGSSEEFAQKVIAIWPQETSPHIIRRFGSFGRWLARRANVKALAPVRKRFATLIARTSGLGPGDQVLVTPIEKRSLHTVLSISRTVGRTTSLIWKIARAQGLVASDGPRPRFSQCLISLQEGDALIELLSDALDEVQIAEKLKMPRSIVRSFVDVGLLEQLAGSALPGCSPLISMSSYSKLEIAWRQALPIVPDSTKMPIHSIVRRTNARIADLVAALIGGLIEGERTVAELSLRDIYLDVEQVKIAQKSPSFVLSSKPAQFIARHRRSKSY